MNGETHAGDSAATETGRLTMPGLILALVGVIAALIGIIGLMPVPADDRETVFTAAAASTAERFLRYTAEKVNTEWTWLDAFPGVKPAGDDFGLEWSESSLFNTSHMQVLYPQATGHNMFSPQTHRTGLFLVRHGAKETSSPGGERRSAVIRMWKTDYKSYDNGSARALLCAEVSWMSDQPYHTRERDTYCVEVMKSGRTDATAPAAP